MACGLRTDVLQVTGDTTTAVPHNGAYWYYVTGGYAIGFAPKSAIDLTTDDTYYSDDWPESTGDYSDCQFRLSWTVDMSLGGYRAGCDLWSSQIWRKRVLVGPAAQLPVAIPAGVQL